LREELAIQGDTSRIGLNPELLIQWAQAPNRLDRSWLRWTAPLLTVLAVATAIVWAIWGLLFPLLAVVLAEILVAYRLKDTIHEAIAAVESAYEDLKGLAVLLNRIEAERFDAPKCKQAH